MSKKFSDLPEKVKDVLRDQIDTTIRMHEATGLPVLECRKIELASGGERLLLDTIESLTMEDLT